jgi:thioredoxin-like negative regulator of GroEL
MFDAYLKAPKRLRPNTPEAKIRLARALHQTGDRARYLRVLQNIIEEHGGTEAAAEARQRMDRLDENSKHSSE